MHYLTACTKTGGPTAPACDALRHQTELFGHFKNKKKREEKGYQAVPLHPEHEVQLGEGFRNMGKNKGEKSKGEPAGARSL